VTWTDSAPAPEGPPERIRAAARGDPFAGTEQARSAGMRTLDVGRDSHIYEAPVYFIGTTPALRPLLVGPVPAAELESRRAVFVPGPGHAAIARALASLRVVALRGEPGSGRLSAGLALLGDLTCDVHRLDPEVEVDTLKAADLAPGAGYVLRPAGDLRELQLDRFGEVLARVGAYAVVLVPEEAAVGRYGVRYQPPEDRALLASHLRGRLAAPEIAAAAALAEDPEVRLGLGLARLRPREARTVAGLVARTYQGELPREELLTRCRALAAEQVHEWFDRLDPYALSPRALRLAAYRIALAAFTGTAQSVVADAAELLAYQLSREHTPDSPLVRPLFGEDPRARIRAARAELGDTGDGGVHYAGDALAPAVLTHVWTRHHNARRPMVGWLHALATDPRPVVRVRAALAAGLCVGLDPDYGLPVVVRPLAADPDPHRRMFAAVAMNQAGHSPAAVPALRAELRAWAADPRLHWTLAATLGYGGVAGSTAQALDEIARIGSTDNPERYAIAGHATVQLLGRPHPDQVLDRIADWLRDSRRERLELGLLAVARLAAAHTGAVAAERPHPDWPLALTLRDSPAVAALLVAGLRDQRSQQAVLDGIATWVRQSATDEPLLAELTDFLPLLAVDRYARQLLASLLARLADRADDQVPPRVTIRLQGALS
jgi:hypothetical protein